MSLIRTIAGKANSIQALAEFCRHLTNGLEVWQA
jgi:hypothetical protein